MTQEDDPVGAYSPISQETQGAAESELAVPPSHSVQVVAGGGKGSPHTSITTSFHGSPFVL
jgi:hypothetical protein